MNDNSKANCDANSYIEAFHEKIEQYGSELTPEALFQLLSIFFDGIENNCSLACAAEESEEGDLSLSYAVRSDGSQALIVLSNPDGEKYPIIADVKLRTIIHMIINDDLCNGVLIDPDESALFIPKYFIAYAISAGYQMALEDIENGDES